MSTTYEARFNKSGNIKIGQIWSFNKLAGSGIINNCKGTCSNCSGCYNEKNPKKSSCYVFKAYNRYGWENSSVVKGHIRNTNIIRNDISKAFTDIENQLKRARNKPGVVRIHSSGELESIEELCLWNSTAAKFPDIKFYIYTKMYDLIENEKFYKNISDNFFVNISVWHHNGIDTLNMMNNENKNKNIKNIENIENIRAFIYDDGTYDYEKEENLKINCYCPAYNKAGKMNHNVTCDKCGICFSNKENNKICGCYSH